jgi:glycosyltransferase involved in cell wall biosynthesis
VKVAFLTRTVRGGGAERQIVTLAGGLARRGVEVVITTFYRPPADFVAPTGTRLLAGNKRGRWDILGFGLKLWRTLRHERPDVLYSRLPAANYLAVAMRPCLPGTLVALGIGASNVDLGRYDRLSALAYQVERRLARFADVIISNSEAGRRHCVELSYPAERLVVVPNGIDVAAFRRDDAGGARLRAEWRIGDDGLAVGVVGRLDPMKDHATFLDALSILAPRFPSLRGVIVGDGPGELRRRLEAHAAARGIADRLIWGAARNDVVAVYSALDCLCLSSAFGEGLPNVVAEAMACGTPCAVTDVGDTAQLVAHTGRVVPPRDPAALAAAIESILRLDSSDRVALGEAARQRVVDLYGIDRLVDATLASLDVIRRKR